ncbi:hypothetical protein [Pseudomonas syringae]|uniref:hypothetical protein n=1 Tax=Pseudomonas syringae TaxID=317 RepID=UPI0003FF124E|nr:hypothetical protein [Pseudomonas syringae]
MLALITCSDAVTSHTGAVEPSAVKRLKKIRASGTFVAIVSNKTKPHWFDATFQDTGISFIRTEARQKGLIIREIAHNLKIQTYDILVLAVKSEDMQMAKNGHALLIAAGWSNDPVVKKIGISVKSGGQLEELVRLADSWTGHWWFKSEKRKYAVNALADLSGFGGGITPPQKIFASKLTETVKNGGTQLTALLLVTARSLLIDGIYDNTKPLWGVYPSSNSKNTDTEVLSEFTHQLRTTVSQAHYSKRFSPLFIRHSRSIKRSTDKSADRSDPADQIATMHLNPIYKAGLKKKDVIILDDCTTHGLSFGVASAFLLAAGAASVTGIALGKFGHALKYFDITISSDPFSPVSPNGFTINAKSTFQGKDDNRAQQTLISLLP